MANFPGNGSTLEVIVPSQGNAEVQANSALALLFMLIPGKVISRTTTAQPGSPAEGDGYLLPGSATGTAWATHDGQFAYYHNAVWYFAELTTGTQLFVADENVVLVFNGTSWVSASAASTICFQAHLTAWTNMPAALTEFRSGQAGTLRDLRLFNQVRVFASQTIAGFAGAKLRLQYSDDVGASWNYFDSDGANSGPSIAVDGTGYILSSWITMDAAARIEDCFVRVVGLDGDGIVDPAFNIVEAHFR